MGQEDLGVASNRCNGTHHSNPRFDERTKRTRGVRSTMPRTRTIGAISERKVSPRFAKAKGTTIYRWAKLERPNSVFSRSLLTAERGSRSFATPRLIRNRALLPVGESRPFFTGKTRWLRARCLRILMACNTAETPTESGCLAEHRCPLSSLPRAKKQTND